MLQRNKIRDLLLGLVGMLFLISGAVTLTLSFRGLYRFDVKRLHLAEETGYSEEEILDNYNELIDYNLSPAHTQLKFPTFPMSEEAEIHFREVKVIFQGFLKLLIVTGILYLASGLYLARKNEWRFLKYTGICSLVIPAVAGLLVALNWDWVFVTFHELVFPNDYWLFDPVTDPVILVLPDEFFLHCAVLLIGLVLAGAFICIGVYHAGQVHHRKRLSAGKREYV